MSTGEKLLRAANAVEHRKFFQDEATAALDAAVAAQTPKVGQAGFGRRMLARADAEKRNAR